eukprot:gene3680-7321_t
MASSIALTVTATPDKMDHPMDAHLIGDNSRAGKLTTTICFRIYIIISGAFAIVEPILVAYRPEGVIFRAQVIVLVISTVLYPIGIIATILHMREVSPIGVSYNSLRKKIKSAFDGEVLMELVCLIIGWSCIFVRPGVAALRCFRVLRFLWYFEFFPAERGSFLYVPSVIFHICLRYIEKLRIELFTAKSRGAIVILILFFYISYILGCVFWVEIGLKFYVHTDDTDQVKCNTVTNCMLTMMRLAFYDDDEFKPKIKRHQLLNYIKKEHVEGVELRCGQWSMSNQRFGNSKSNTMFSKNRANDYENWLQVVSIVGNELAMLEKICLL